MRKKIGVCAEVRATAKRLTRPYNIAHRRSSLMRKKVPAHAPKLAHAQKSPAHAPKVPHAQRNLRIRRSSCMRKIPANAPKLAHAQVPSMCRMSRMRVSAGASKNAHTFAHVREFFRPCTSFGACTGLCVCANFGACAGFFAHAQVPSMRRMSRMRVSAGARMRILLRTCGIFFAHA